MVNRGGRSKGCATCRRRRVKCDESRPHCQRCQKAGLACSGYAQHAQFVDETARFRRDETRRDDASPQRNEMQVVAVPPPMSLRPDEDTVIHTHLVARLLPRISGPAAPDILASMVSYESVTGAAVPLHKDALRALAAVYFGKVHHDTRIVDTGMHAYVRSLRRLRTALADPVAVLDVETLASVLCLGLYENVALTETTGWLAHYDGIAHLIERRGPSRHQSGFDHELFRHCRFAIIISALVHRRHCYLAQPEWRAISRPSSPETSNTLSSRKIHQEEDLNDLFAQVPGILHEFGVAQTPDASPESVADLLRRVEDFLSALSTWRLQFQEPVTHTSLLALHNAILLCLAPVCEAFELPLVTGDMPTEGARRSLASGICRLAKESFDRSPSSTGAFLFIFPLHVAARHLPPGTEEATWVETAMQRVIVETHGFEIGRPRTWHLQDGQMTGADTRGNATLTTLST